MDNKILEHLEPVTAHFIQALAAKGGPPLYKLSLQEARDVLTNLQATSSVKVAPTTIEELTIPGGPKGPISLSLVRPLNNTSTLPVVMYFHGGGWILGNEHTHDRLIRQIAHDAQVAIAFVNYTPSPEAHYPIAIEEAYTATVYMAEHAHKHNLDSSSLVIAGDSVGGNMAAVVALLAKERQGPAIAYQMLFYPVTDARMNTSSYEQFAQGPWLTKAAMEWFWDAYEPDKAARNKPTLSPLQTPLDHLKNLPPALVITDENDVLRDEGEAYAHKLMQAGVPVKAIRILGTCHDFLMLNPLADTPPVQAALALIKATLQEIIADK